MAGDDVLPSISNHPVASNHECYDILPSSGSLNAQNTKERPTSGNTGTLVPTVEINVNTPSRTEFEIQTLSQTNTTRN